MDAVKQFNQEVRKHFNFIIICYPIKHNKTITNDGPIIEAPILDEI